MHFRAAGDYGPLIVALAILPFSPGAATRWTQYSDYTTIVGLADAGRHLWMATAGGLVRLDKVSGEKTYFNQANSALTDTRVHTLVSDGEGRILAATHGNCLVEFDGATWSNLSLAGPLKGQIILDAEVPDQDRLGRNVLWVLAWDPVAREASLFQRNVDTWVRFYLTGFHAPGPEYGAYIGSTDRPSLQVDGEGIAWVWGQSRDRELQSQQVLYRISPGGDVDAVPIPVHLNPHLFIAPKSGNHFWICRRALAWPSPDGWITSALPDGMYSKRRFASFHPRHAYIRTEDHGQYFFLLSNHRERLMRLREGKWEPVPLPEDTLPPPSRPPPWIMVSGAKWDPAESKDGLWLGHGSSTGPVVDGEWHPMRIRRTPLGLGFPSNLYPGAIGSSPVLIAYRETDMHARSVQARIAPFDDQSGLLSPPLDFEAHGVPSGPIESAVMDKRGRVWVNGSGWLARMAWEGVTVFTPHNSPWTGRMARMHISAGLAVDAKGTVWAADSNRLWAIPEGTADTGSWKSHDLAIPGHEVKIGGIACHRDGSVWALARSNSRDPRRDIVIARLSGNKWTVLDNTDHDWIRYGRDMNILCDAAGNTWVLFPDGLFQWDGEAWMEHSPSRSRYLETGIQAMALHPTGELWVASRAPKAALWKWDFPSTHLSGHWSQVEGTAEHLSTSLVTRMAFDDSKGTRLWMISDNSLMVFDPALQEIEPSLSLPAQPSHPIKAGPGPSLARTSSGRWRIFPGTQAGEESLRILLHDLRGRAIPGSESELRPASSGEWFWGGPNSSLAPGNYLLRLEGRTQKAILPFHHGRP